MFFKQLPGKKSGVTFSLQSWPVRPDWETGHGNICKKSLCSGVERCCLKYLISLRFFPPPKVFGKLILCLILCTKSLKKVPLCLLLTIQYQSSKVKMVACTFKLVLGVFNFQKIKNFLTNYFKKGHS